MQCCAGAAVLATWTGVLDFNHDTKPAAVARRKHDAEIARMILEAHMYVRAAPHACSVLAVN